MTELDRYRAKRRKAVAIPDKGGYDINSGQMNPEIYRKFAGLIAGTRLRNVYEPFAGPDGSSFQHFDAVGVSLYAHSLVCNHPRLVEADSTTTIPDYDYLFSGVMFHPPYFGSALLSDDDREISLISDEDEWVLEIEGVAAICMDIMLRDGFVCAVGRRYRHGGKEIKLDEWLATKIFHGMKVHEVWTSIPDIAIIMKFEE